MSVVNLQPLTDIHQAFAHTQPGDYTPVQITRPIDPSLQIDQTMFARSKPFAQSLSPGQLTNPGQLANNIYDNSYSYTTPFPAGTLMPNESSSSLTTQQHIEQNNRHFRRKLAALQRENIAQIEIQSSNSKRGGEDDGKSH